MLQDLINPRAAQQNPQSRPWPSMTNRDKPRHAHWHTLIIFQALLLRCDAKWALAWPCCVPRTLSWLLPGCCQPAAAKSSCLHQMAHCPPCMSLLLVDQWSSHAMLAWSASHWSAATANAGSSGKCCLSTLALLTCWPPRIERFLNE